MRLTRLGREIRRHQRDDSHGLAATKSAVDEPRARTTDFRNDTDG